MKFYILILAAFLVGCQTVDRGSFGHFERSLNTKSYGYQVVDDPTGSAPTLKVERFEVRAGDCASDTVWSDCKNDRERSELSQMTQLENPGSSAWYSWNIYFPKDYATLSPVKTALGQFHQKGSHVVWMFQETGGIGYYLDEQTTGGSINFYQLIAPDQLRGKWHNIVVNVSWSNQPSWSKKQNGFFKVWVNGEQKADYVGPTMVSDEVYFKYGVYRSFISRYLRHNKSVPTQIVYYSNVRRASTRAGLALR